MQIAGTLVTRFGYDGIRSGASIDEVVDIAQYAATHDTPWEDVGCTALVWAITNLAGVPINRSWNVDRAVNNNPLTPGAADVQGYAVSADLAGDGWNRTNLISSANPYAEIAVGDILRIEAVNKSGAYGQHSMIVTQYNGADPSQIWVVDNHNSEVTEHRLSDVIAGMNSNGGIVTFLRHRLDQSYVSENIPNGAEGWADGRFYNISEDLPGDTSATQVLTLGTSLDGAIDFSGDSDWFRVWLDAGNAYSFAVRGSGSGKGSLEDPKIRIRTPDGTHLSEWDNDNSPQLGDGLDARISGFTAETTGYHYITAYANGSGVGTYQISGILSTASTNNGSSVSTTPGATGSVVTSEESPVPTSTEDSEISTTQNLGGFDENAGSNETDISNEFAGAYELTPNGTPVTSYFEDSEDLDVFSVELEAGTTYDIALTAASPDTLDTILSLYDSNTVLASDDDDGGTARNSFMTYTALDSGTYYLKAETFFALGDGGYQVSVTAREPVILPSASNGDDDLYGSNYGDELYGLAGNDTIVGQVGNDTLYGNAGRDRLFGGSGKDEIYGQKGNDVLRGEGGSDILEGGSGRDRLFGNSENDQLFGQRGNDKLSGGSGWDLLYGGAGNDKLFGGSDRDNLYGGRGNDTLKGGAGMDTFVFNDTPIFRNADKIKDFVSGDDRIFLSIADFESLTEGWLSETEFTANSEGVAEDAEDRIVYDSTYGRLYYDEDGSGVASRQLIAILEGTPDLLAGDIYAY